MILVQFKDKFRRDIGLRQLYLYMHEQQYEDCKEVMNPHHIIKQGSSGAVGLTKK